MMSGAVTGELAILRLEMARLEEENRRLQRTITILERQVRGLGAHDENRRLRAKLAEWEGSTTRINGVYHHGSRAILPFVNKADPG